jgi:hypothetical protein
VATSEAVVSAVVVPVLQVEAVALAEAAVEAVLLVAMQVDADKMNSEQLIVNSEK